MSLSPRLLRPWPRLPFPLTIPGLVAWGDPTDLSTLSQTSNGLTPVTATSQPVASWRCKISGQAAINTVDANRPLYDAAAINGRGALSFDGTNDDLVFPANALWNVTDMTLIVVASPGVAKNAGIFTKSNININPNGFGLQQRSSGHMWFQGDDNEAEFASAAYASPVLLVAVERGTPTTQRLRVNDTIATPGAVTTSYAANRDVHIGTRRPGTEFYQGFIAEFLFYNRALTDAEVTALLVNYLKPKWGLSVT